MKTQKVKLGSVLKLHYGKGLKKAHRIGGDVPVYGSNGIVGYHFESIIDEPTIVVGRKGSIGKLHFAKVPCWPIDTTYFTEHDPKKVDLQWLYYQLGSSQIESLNTAAAIPGLNRDRVYDLNIQLPSLTDQKRIARVLSHCEALVQKRKESITLLDDLLKGAFLEMFSKDNADYENWSLAPIQEYAMDKKGSMRTGPFGSDLLHNEFAEAGPVRVVGIDNVVNNVFEYDKPRFITLEKFESLKRYQVFPGDVLISIMATNGRSAIVPEDIGTAINSKHLAAITLDTNRVLPYYVKYAFQYHPMILKQLSKNMKGAIMSGLNLTIIKNLSLPEPPISLQSQFANIVAKVDTLKKQFTQSLEELEQLYGSLSQQAFKGELDVSMLELEVEGNLSVAQALASIRETQDQISRMVHPTPELAAAIRQMNTFFDQMKEMSSFTTVQQTLDSLNLPDLFGFQQIQNVLGSAGLDSLNQINSFEVYKDIVNLPVFKALDFPKPFKIKGLEGFYNQYQQELGMVKPEDDGLKALKESLLLDIDDFEEDMEAQEVQVDSLRKHMGQKLRFSKAYIKKRILRSLNSTFTFRELLDKLEGIDFEEPLDLEKVKIIMFDWLGDTRGPIQQQFDQADNRIIFKQKHEADPA